MCSFKTETVLHGILLLNADIVLNAYVLEHLLSCLHKSQRARKQKENTQDRRCIWLSKQQLKLESQWISCKNSVLESVESAAVPSVGFSGRHCSSHSF